MWTNPHRPESHQLRWGDQRYRPSPRWQTESLFAPVSIVTLLYLLVIVLICGILFTLCKSNHCLFQNFPNNDHVVKKFTEAIVAVAVAKCVVIVAWIVVRLVTWKKRGCCLIAWRVLLICLNHCTYNQIRLAWIVVRILEEEKATLIHHLFHRWIYAQIIKTSEDVQWG